MVADQYTYNKGRTFARRVAATFAVFFGLFALFFTATPKLWNSGSASQNMFGNFFTQNTAHADTPEGSGQYESNVTSFGETVGNTITLTDGSTFSGFGPMD